MGHITRLIEISKNSVEMANEIELLMRTTLQSDSINRNLASRVLASFDDLIPHSGISLDQLAQNNYEFLDTLKTIVARLLQRSDKTYNEKAKLKSLDVNIASLITELNSPPFLQHREQTPTDEKKQHSKQTKRNQYPAEALITLLKTNQAVIEW
jgi:hypothetical protein